MKELIQVVFSPGKCIGGKYLDKESCDKLGRCEDEEQAKGPLQSYSSVLCVLRRCALSSVGVVPTVQFSPSDILIQSVENNSVHLSLASLPPDGEWYLFSLEMVKDIEEAQTWNEEADHGYYPPQ